MLFMKIETSRNELLKPIAAVFPAIERRNHLPILSNILIRAEADLTRFTATDLEVELQVASSQCLAAAPAATTLPGKRLLDILRAFPDDGTVVLTVEGEKATLRCGRSRFTLQALPAEDYPAADDREFGSKITLLQASLRQAIQQTAYAMAEQDVRYYLNGLLFEFDESGLKLCATDGHRLALREVPNSAVECPEPRQVILPNKGVQSLFKLLADSGEAPATIEIGLNHLRAEVGETRLTSKLIDGKFPDYHRVIPQNQSQVAIMDRVQFLDLLRRVGLVLAGEKTSGLCLEFSDWLLKVSAKNAEREEADEELDINYQGGPMALGFNVTYLRETVAVLSGELVKVQFTDPQSSIKIENAEGNEGVHVVMPMRL
jgi:DNA polymerase-3 subunit beta